MDVKCGYCGNYMSETMQKCPNCGAVNTQYFRAAKDTPKTIAELQAWYQAHHLPPEEKTRFFIGRDIKEARAFGIYQDGEEFIVYKNKADGTRAIRYQGTDEEYAVNELYLKLKAEILEQKNKQVVRVEVPLKRDPPREDYQKIPTERTRREEEFTKKSLDKVFFRTLFSKVRLPKLNITWMNIVPFVITLVVLGVIFGIISIGREIRNNRPKTGYYYLEDEDLYYNYGYNKGEYEWWKYDKSDDNWKLYSYEEKEKNFPFPLDKESERSSSLPFENHTEYTYEKYNIKTSHGYIDVHHVKPKQNYYIYDGDTYYFLDDYKGNNTGWYIYDDSGEQWEFYAPYNDKESVGGALWYDPTVYSVAASEKDDKVSNFEDTTYYQEYYAANHDTGHSHEQQSQHDDDFGGWVDSDSSWDYSDWDSNDSSGSSWDSDNSWDSGSSWDYGDSGWDSGSSDWGSDWDSGGSYDWDSGSSWDYGDSGWDSGSSSWDSDW